MHKYGKQFDLNLLYGLSAIKSQHLFKKWVGAVLPLTHFLNQGSQGSTTQIWDSLPQLVKK